jgi:hypothetical protein
MPEVNPRPKKQLLAAVMFVSAIVLFGLAMLFYTGVVPLADEVRLVATVAVLIAAAADLAMALWFFRQGQSS